MTPRVIGTREDVAGFALAGVEGTICESQEDVQRAWSALRDDEIAILSPAAALMIAERMAEAEEHDTGPLFVVLPR